jgi:cell wall-associated NlpC family hydrolase
VLVAVRFLLVTLTLAVPTATPPAYAAMPLADAKISPAHAETALAYAVDRPTGAELDKRIAAASQQLEVVVEQYDDSRDALQATQNRARILTIRLAPLTRDQAVRQRMINALAARTYRNTGNSPTMALFTSDSPQQFVQRLLIVDELATEQQRAITDLGRARTRLSDTRTALGILAAQQRREQLLLSTRRATVEGEITTLKQLRQIAYGGGSRFGDGGEIPVPEYVAGPAGSVVAFAFSQLGKPYNWGADGPGAYDCSGLTLAAWRSAGIDLPHNAARQYESMAHPDRDDLRPGDLIFFYGRISHVGVYIGNGKMIHAPEYGERVRVAPIDSQPIHGFGRPD